MLYPKRRLHSQEEGLPPKRSFIRREASPQKEALSQEKLHSQEEASPPKKSLPTNGSLTPLGSFTHKKRHHP
jgi:hypothetical protein